MGVTERRILIITVRHLVRYAISCRLRLSRLVTTLRRLQLLMASMLCLLAPVIFLHPWGSLDRELIQRSRRKSQNASNGSQKLARLLAFSQQTTTIANGL